MRTRGRISVAEKTGVVIAGDFGKRPDPPDSLTPRQTEIWREVVASEDVHFFDTGALRGMLADYCRHRESGEKLTAIMDGYPTEWLRNGEALERYQKLGQARDRETRGALTLATKLRLTNQSRYTPQAAATAARHATKGNKPWEG